MATERLDNHVRRRDLILTCAFGKGHLPGLLPKRHQGNDVNHRCQPLGFAFLVPGDGDRDLVLADQLQDVEDVVAG
jgi:hypothetical protein